MSKEYYVVERLTLLVASYVQAESADHAKAIVLARGDEEYDITLACEETAIIHVSATTEN
jgi:hypothetical protein